MKKLIGIIWVVTGLLWLVWIMVLFRSAPLGEMFADAWLPVGLGIFLATFGLLYALKVRWAGLMLGLGVTTVFYFASGALIFDAIRWARTAEIVVCLSLILLSVSSEVGIIWLWLQGRNSRKLERDG